MELVTVIALLAMLATLAYLNVGVLISRTQAHAAAANLLLAREGMLRLAVDCGGLPVWTGTAGDPGLSTRPTWAPTCWRGPYLNSWPSKPGTYEFDGPGGTTAAVVRVRSIPGEAIQPVAAQIVGVFGSSATLRYASATGWSAEIPVSREYQATLAAATNPPASDATSPATITPVVTTVVVTPGSISPAGFRPIGGEWSVVDGSLQGSGTSKAIADVTSANYTYGVDLQTLHAGKAVTDVSRVVFNYQDDQNYYAVVPRSNGVLDLGKMQGGKWTAQLISVKKTGLDPTQTHHYEVTVVGSAVTVSVDGKTLLTYTDKKPVASGGVGIANSSSTGAFGNATLVAAK